MFSKLKEKVSFNNLFSKKYFILPTIILSLGIMLPYNPFSGINVKSFDRTLGNGMLNGVDITKRINNIISFDFIIIPIILLLVYLIISNICKNVGEESDEIVKFINMVSAIALAPMIFAHINKFSHPDALGIEVIFPCIILTLAIIYLGMSSRGRKLDFNIFKWCIFSIIPISLLILLIFYKLDWIIVNKQISLFLNSSIFIMIFTFLFIIFFSIITIYNKQIDFLLLKKAYMPVMIAPIIVSICLELINILNQYSIFIKSKFNITITIYGICFVSFIGFYFWLKFHKNSTETFCFEKYYYPLLIIAFALIAVQPSLQNIFNTDFFEQSNHGTAISGLFNFGKLPIVETFDAHMMQNQIGNIMYGILNNDFQGAIFLGYNLLPIFVILYYFLFTKFFNRDISFFLMLLYPIMSDSTYILFSLAPLVILSFLYAYKSKKYKAYILYWLSVGVTCLFKLDMGFALTFASIITWGIMWFLKKNTVSIKKLSLSCFSILVSVGIIFSGMCLLKGISPLKRIIEFLNLCKSNINWAYSSMGNMSMTAFVVCYFMIPAITAILIIVFIFKKFQNGDFTSDNRFIISLIIGLLCMFNLSRGIVRHSLVENTNIHIISSAPLFISMFIYIFSKKNKLTYFCISNIIFMMVFSLMINLNSVLPSTVINSSLSRYLSFDSYKTVALEKTQRVVLSDDMNKIYIPLKQVLDKTLLSNETYIDFTNQTLLYALTEREKPMYVNQSPGLLSGEYTQQKFIEQCEQISEKVPFVLMPLEPMNLSNDLDGIQNAYRYYLVSEYINNNFKPLFRTGQFAIWCRNERFDEKASLVSKLVKDDQQSYFKVALSEESKTVLTAHNEEVSIVNNELILKSTNVDPILIGLENLMNIKASSFDYPYINVSIEYDSDKAGLFELFYTTQNSDDFNPKKVVSKNMPKEGVFEATIPYTKNTKMRFDIPENSTVKIKNIRFKGIEDLGSNQIKSIDYNYMTIDNHSYHLINIPYIWANYDKIGIDKKDEQMIINKKSSIYDFSSIDKKNGNYLFVNASSANNGIMTVQLGKQDENGFVALSQFDFSLKKGDYQNYLVRLSSDFMWYSNQINAIKITSDNNSNLDKISILKGDTLR